MGAAKEGQPAARSLVPVPFPRRTAYLAWVESPAPLTSTAPAPTAALPAALAVLPGPRAAV